MAATDRDTLPSSVVPSHYELSLHDLDFKSWSYQGTVKITLNVKESTQEIVLNTLQLKIKEAEIKTDSNKHEEALKTTDVSYLTERHRATLKFASTIPVAQIAVLTIKFSGTLNNDMAGFYRSKYKPIVPASKSVPHDDEFHYMFSTQFESCDARRAFPCFDEPSLKATFAFEIEIPEDQTALSNMPEKETRKGTREGTKVVVFEQAPKMSTYLFAWAFGDFEYVEDFTRRKYNGRTLPVRVYTTRGLKDQGRFALKNAYQIVDLFSEVFKIDYPLPKADLLAVHEFSHGAMENWGLVTYRTTAVLFDEKNSDAKYKNRVAYVVAHELAHQWFGNLVTMEWWNHLWLNEGFATWVGWYAVDRLYPEWNVFGQFVTEGGQQALTLDSIRGSHPIEVPVRDALEVDQIFDAISYLKGSSVIRMLSSYLGTEIFLDGVADYLKAHAYGNALTEDLWSALSKASGKDVNAFANNWITKIGYPILTVAEEPDQISIRQTRFLSTGDVKAEDDETTWWIPLNLKTSAKSTEFSTATLTTKEDTIRNVPMEFYKLNADTTGFYRTNYPPARLAKLGTQIDQLTVEDKIGLIGDASALAVSGEGTTPAVLAFLEPFQAERNYLVWSQLLTSLGNIRSIFSSSASVSSALKTYTLKLVTPAVEALGWDFTESEDFLTVQLRAQLILAAGLAGHESIIKEAQKQFAAYTAGDKQAIHPNLRSAVYRIAVTYGGKEAYEAVKHDFLTTTTVDGKEIALHALGRVQTTELATEYFNFLLHSGSVAIQDVHSGAIALAANSKTRDTLWQLIKKDWSTVKEKLFGNPVVLDRFVRVSLNKFASVEVADDIRDFFKDKDNKGYDRSLGIVQDTVRGHADYVKRDQALIEEWLSAHEYA